MGGRDQHCDPSRPHICHENPRNVNILMGSYGLSSGTDPGPMELPSKAKKWSIGFDDSRLCCMQLGLYMCLQQMMLICCVEMRNRRSPLYLDRISICSHSKSFHCCPQSELCRLLCHLSGANAQWLESEAIVRYFTVPRNSFSGAPIL